MLLTAPNSGSYSIGDNVGSSPAVVNGVVYVGSEISNLFGTTYNGTVYALNALTATNSGNTPLAVILVRLLQLSTV